MSIYPKLAAARSVSVNEGTCFLLMPFDRDLQVVHAAIKDVCHGTDIRCERADDIYSQRPIFSSILDSIISSEIIISDLTGKNANVFYETGIAHSVREPQSVILIAQSMDFVPFDLRHLPIVLYRLENMQKFEVELEHRIRRSRVATMGVNFAINYLYPLHFQRDDVKSFIDYANELSTDFFLLLAKCMRVSPDSADETASAAEISSVFAIISRVSEASNGRWKRICDHLRLELLCTPAYFDKNRERCQAYLRQASINQYEIKERDEDFFAAELSFRLIERDLAKNIAIHWLLEYLHNPRMGNIDVVRYKIETFIVQTTDSDLDSSLLALLTAPTPSIRENAADMVGQKTIPNAGRYLMNALAVEQNPYAARSAITAIARQSTTDAVDTIINWVRMHSGKWWEEPISYTLHRVAEDTVRKLAGDGQALSRLQEALALGKSSNRE